MKNHKTTTKHTVHIPDVHQEEFRKIVMRLQDVKICAHCNDEYFYTRADQKYCSDSCRVMACRKRGS